MLTVTLLGKGGTGKTTSTASLGSAYAALGYRTLLIDSDSQASMTEWLAPGYRYHDDGSERSEEDLAATGTTGVLTGQAKLPDAAITLTDDLDLLPNTIYGGVAEHYLNNLSRQSELQLAQALHDHADHYDIVLVDTPRAFDSRITFNAVEAADHICIVAEMAQSSLDALPGQLQLLRESERNLTGVIATKVDRRTKKGQTMPDQLRQAGYTVLGEVPISAAFTTVWESRQTPHALLPNDRATQAYDQIAQTLINHK